MRSQLKLERIEKPLERRLTSLASREWPIDEPRRYPQSYADQPLTYLQGMLVPALGVSARDDLALPDPHVHLGLGLTYGIYDFWEVSILPLPVRLSPRAAYEDPSISSTVRVL